MRRVYLLRHAKSDWTDPHLADFDRPLSGRGRRDAARIGACLARREAPPGLVLCSSARRAAETWEIVGRDLGPPPRVALRGDLYLAAPEDLLAAVQGADAAASALILVGHNPGIHALALSLAAAPAGRLEEKYPTGGLAEFVFPADRWADVAAGAGALRGFVVPRDLRPRGE